MKPFFNRQAIKEKMVEISNMLIQKNELSLEFNFKLDRAAEDLAAANLAIQKEKEMQNDITGILASCMAYLMRTCKGKSSHPYYPKLSNLGKPI